MRRTDRREERRRQKRRTRVVVGLAAGMFMVAASTAGTIMATQAGASSGTAPEASAVPLSASPTLPTGAPEGPTPLPTPATAAEQLLADADDTNACAVSFIGDGITDAPELETQTGLYQHLPIPRRDGLVFAGWYTTPEDAAAYAVAERVNGADAVACPAQQLDLFGSWMTASEVAALNVGVPILMYHQFTENPQGETGWLRGNFAYIGDFDAQMAYLAEKQVYLPTWDELSAFIDGALYIPKICAIVTDDDADVSWTTLAAPIVDKDKILTTSFVITTAYPGPPPNPYVIQRSHTHDMHSAGANGEGRIVNYSVDEIVADMTTSADILGGVKQVMAYPYGHYNDTAKDGLREAGFEMARTTEAGYVRAGADKLAMPCQRISYGMGLSAFVGIVG